MCKIEDSREAVSCLCPFAKERVKTPRSEILARSTASQNAIPSQYKSDMFLIVRREFSQTWGWPTSDAVRVRATSLNIAFGKIFQ